MIERKKRKGNRSERVGEDIYAGAVAVVLPFGAPAGLCPDRRRGTGVAAAPAWRLAWALAEAMHTAQPVTTS